MIYTSDYLPQFRDAGENGLVGLRGYYNYFQDMITQYMHSIDKGNDTIPEKYGITWIVTRYRLNVYEEADYHLPLHMETWIEPGSTRARIHMGLTIYRDKEVYAEGRTECCLMDLNSRKLTGMDAIELPKDLAEERELHVAPFTRFSSDMDGFTYVFTQTVRYTDLDKTRHMTNLKYIDLLMNAFDSDFYRTHRVTNFEIRYETQCFEGEEIKVYVKQVGEQYFLYGIKKDGSIAVAGLMEAVNA